MTTSSHTASRYAIPLALVAAGALIATAVILSGDRSSTPPSTHAGAQPTVASNIRTPSEADHVRGDRAAPIAIVEFSDFECPFCARLHPTLARIVAEMPNVQWVYRHFPLTTIHRRALGAAVASECIARLGGNDAFWNFADAAFGGAPSLNDTWYEQVARDSGIDAQAFASCRNDDAVVAAVRDDAAEAASAGGRGTPFVVIIAADGTQTSFSGALPYEQVIRLVERARGS